MTKFISDLPNLEFRWSLERYHQAIELGVLTELDKVELPNVKEYWIVNIPERQVELHLNPSPEKGLYRSLSVHEAGAQFTSPFCGNADAPIKTNS